MIKKRKPVSKQDRQSEISYLAEKDKTISFSKKDKLKEKLKQCQNEKGEYLTQLQRTRADFINYRNRQEQLSEAMLARGKTALISDLLPILDALDAGAKKDKSIAHIKELLKNTLKAHKIEKIETKGKKFDYRLHEAVSQADSDKEKGMIIKEVQVGYMIGEQVLRPSKVIVAK